jgi:hypothetical protein
MSDIPYPGSSHRGAGSNKSRVQFHKWSGVETLSGFQCQSLKSIVLSGTLQLYLMCTFTHSAMCYQYSCIGILDVSGACWCIP